MSGSVNGVFLWRTFITACITLGFSGLGAVSWWGLSLIGDMRDQTRDHGNALTRIEEELKQALPAQWKLLNDHEARIRVLEVVRPSSEHAR